MKKTSTEAAKPEAVELSPANYERQWRMYETVLSNIPDFVYVFSLDHRVLYANEALIEMWGRGHDGAIGKTFLEIGYEPWHAEMHSREIDQVRTTRQPVRGEVPFNGTNGRRYYDYIFVPVIGADGEVGAVAGNTRDVTERKEAERQLRDGQEQLDFAVAAADLGQWSLNLADHTASRTLRHDQIFGYDILLPEWTYEMFLEHVVPADRAEVDADFHKSVASGSPWSIECRIRRTDGAVRHIWTKGQVRRDAGDRIERMVGIIGDITDRRQAEERQAFQIRLIETLRPLSNAVEVQSEASRLLGEHLGANRVVYFEIRGDEYVIEWDYTAGVQPLAGRYPVAAFGAALLAMLREGRTVIEVDATTELGRPPGERAAFAGIQVRGHVDVPLVKGGRLVAGMTVHVSNPRHWSPQEVGLIEDTAERTWAALERVRAEVALQQSEERLAFVRRSSGVGFWYCDLPFDVLQWDDLVKDHFHLPPDATVTIDTFYDRIHPDDREPTRQAIERSIGRRTPYKVDYRTVNPDTGALKWVRAIGRTFYAADGTPTRFDGVTLDVSEQKQAEATLKDNEQRLREADRRKDEFLATLAHELRNPLAPIRSGLEVIRMVGADGTIEQTRSMMERQLLQMTRLVDDLLDLSRLTTGKFELRTERVPLREVISAALETSRPVIEHQGHALSVDVPDEPIFVDGDPTRLAQVVSNLLANSAKYTHRGGHIRLSVSLDDAVAAVAVADDGIGIPRDMLEAVFEMFTQGDGALEKSTGGLGIGLSLVKGVVQMHGGTVEAKSEGKGKGSEFVVRLPVAPAAVRKLEPSDASAAGAAPAHPRRILIVDDNVDAANSLGQLLEMMGNEVLTSYNGESGLKAAAAFRPGVILCDIGMPKMNGYEVARSIRAEDWGKNAVLFALTGYGQVEDLRKSADAGFDHHLVKPVEIDALMALLAGFLPQSAR